MTATLESGGQVKELAASSPLASLKLGSIEKPKGNVEVIRALLCLPQECIAHWLMLFVFIAFEHGMQCTASYLWRN